MYMYMYVCISLLIYRTLNVNKYFDAERIRFCRAIKHADDFERLQRIP